MSKVHLDFLGCRLNQAEIEQMGRQFAEQGYALVDTPEDADLMVLNTCAVTSKAGKESRKRIRQAARANPDLAIVATGCYAHIEPEKVAALPNVSEVVTNVDKDLLVPMVTDEPAYEREPHQRDPLPPGTLGRTRAFVKVQDGCDNRCTFCVTTIARGKGRSRPMAEIISEIQALVDTGYQEVVLTGVHLGSYGHDFGNKHGLQGLVKAVLYRTSLKRLRLSSLEPWDLSPTFFDLWQDERLLPHLHLPLQSGCDATLRRMARKTSQTQFRTLIDAARSRIPDLAVTTDMIVGFPGETEDEFATSLAFAREMGFARMHCFSYSARPGTAAARMPGQVHGTVMRERMDRMLALNSALSRTFLEGQVGREVSVLLESMRGSTPGGAVWTGYTPNYAPVEVVLPEPADNNIVSIRLVEVRNGTLIGV